METSQSLESVAPYAKDVDWPLNMLRSFYANPSDNLSPDRRKNGIFHLSIAQ